MGSFRFASPTSIQLWPFKVRSFPTSSHRHGCSCLQFSRAAPYFPNACWDQVWRLEHDAVASRDCHVSRSPNQAWINVLPRNIENCRWNIWPRAHRQKSKINISYGDTRTATEWFECSAFTQSIPKYPNNHQISSWSWDSWYLQLNSLSFPSVSLFYGVQGYMSLKPSLEKCRDLISGPLHGTRADDFSIGEHLWICSCWHISLSSHMFLHACGFVQIKWVIALNSTTTFFLPRQNTKSNKQNFCQHANAMRFDFSQTVKVSPRK